MYIRPSGLRNQVLRSIESARYSLYTFSFPSARKALVRASSCYRRSSFRHYTAFLTHPAYRLRKSVPYRRHHRSHRSGGRQQLSRTFPKHRYVSSHHLKVLFLKNEALPLPADIQGSSGSSHSHVHHGNDWQSPKDDRRVPARQRPALHGNTSLFLSAYRSGKDCHSCRRIRLQAPLNAFPHSMRARGHRPSPPAPASLFLQQRSPHSPKDRARPEVLYGTHTRAPKSVHQPNLRAHRTGSADAQDPVQLPHLRNHSRSFPDKLPDQKRSNPPGKDYGPVLFPRN